MSAAKEVYKNCLAISDCNGRLAIMALEERDYQEADRWAQLGAKRKDAAAYVVLGALSQMRGDDASATQAYEKADYLMKSAADRYQFLPIYFAEQSRLKQGLEWVFKRKQSARRN